ncbi:glucose-1-phosphate adenylyltransferase [Sporomusa termitida]|uniref:Glucose-1-phosphate adenylyltransferase n=1 Tax=Sporomusa termitida TaxID=2377 RepID=A0A517E0T6_9FIRM|nr:glucose-1-phosphate adenylyltransferase [Sporomusa termitida]QDR83210.1 Glucose-1-phosphate adenylyltransferase [Sporomusa termitida]
MRNKEWIAMILAGGQGTRLGALTKDLAKPAVPFGGQYRIIDFTLSNCRNSGLDTVGILTQYEPFALHAYVGNGSAWDLDRRDGGVHILPPYAREQGRRWYAGTADAVFQNKEFIEQYEPGYVAVLSGDHVYKMDYAAMLEYHKLCQADVTMGVIEVPGSEVSRFGIVETAAGGRITDFIEKPCQSKSTQASMGVYIFSWKVLKQYLLSDAANKESGHDFGRDIIPGMLAARLRLQAYRFPGYWKDVGTVDSYWEANMDLLGDDPKIRLTGDEWPVYSPSLSLPPHYHGLEACVRCSLIAGGAIILGEVENSVIFPGVYIGPGARVTDSVVLPQVRLESGVTVNGAIVTANTVVRKDAAGSDRNGIITVTVNRQSEACEAPIQVSLAG